KASKNSRQALPSKRTNGLLPHGSRDLHDGLSLGASQTRHQVALDDDRVLVGGGKHFGAVVTFSVTGDLDHVHGCTSAVGGVHCNLRTPTQGCPGIIEYP